MPHIKLGQILIEQGLITESQLQEAMVVQKRERSRIGEVLIKMGAIKEEDLAMAIGTQLLIPYASRTSGLLKPQMDQGLDKLIPMEYAQKHLILPLSRNVNSLTCAVFDPLDLIMLDNLKKITGCEINLVVTTKSDLIRSIQEFYFGDKPGGEGRVTMLDTAVENSYSSLEENFAQPTKSASDGMEAELSLDKLIAKAEEAPVVKLVDLIIRQAIDERASDIHIEPFKDKLEVRYRIDGVLYQIPPPAKHLHLAIASRIKIMARLDIAEKRLPQDGAISAKLENRVVDLRVSTIPTVWGEKVVMRILDKDAVRLDLAQLGYDAKQLTLIRKTLKSSYGLFFVTGPTGSGKSTTLYSSLSEVLDPTKNILTVEDPVEFKLDGVNQVSVRGEIGLTFATALRAFLRQDPDIIMVGEVRDLDTAQICVRAALTGHLVLSTLHTNDAPSAITRLMDIGIPNFLLTPSLIMIVAQRLARKLCSKCKEAYEPTAEKQSGIKLNADLIYRAKGCDDCNHTGYKGRLVLGEVMAINDEIRSLIAQKATYNDLRDAARKNGMDTLYESGLKRVEEGLTSLDEILSVTTMNV